MWREHLLQALGNFKSNRTRTLLSLLGIIIGVASVIIVSTLTESGIHEATKGFQDMGLDTLTLMPGWQVPRGKRRLAFDTKLVNELRRALPDALSISGTARGYGSAAGSGTPTDFEVLAVESSYINDVHLALDYGQGISLGDEIRLAPVAVLGADVARTLFPEGKPLGKYISVRFDQYMSRFKVLGVLEKKESMMMTGDPNRSILVPLSTWQTRQTGSKGVDSIIVRIADPGKAMEFQGRIRSFLDQKAGYPEAAYIMTPQEWQEQIEQQKAILTMVFSGVAGISLLVGGIGIMNIMLVSVTERRREIGIRKAIGARPRDIRGQFLLEASLLTGIGGIIGIGAGLGISLLTTMVLQWAFLTSLPAALVALGFSTAMGLFFGYYPASRASRLEPIAALNDE